MEKNKCIIFGASKTGKTAYHFLQEKYDIVGFSDNSSVKWGGLFCGKKVLEPSVLVEQKDTLVVIASVYYAAINKQLYKMGIKNVKVFFLMGSVEDNRGEEYQLFEIPPEGLFQGCIYDERNISRIVKDFSLNYGAQAVNKDTLLKDTKRKKVLFCSYIFPPLGGSGVQRSLKFAKYIRKYGYEPIILTVGKNDGRVIFDDSLLSEIPDDIMVLRVDNHAFIPELLSKEEQQQVYNLYCGIVQSKEWMDEYLQVMEQYKPVLIPDRVMTWVNECLKQIETLVNLDEIDIVYTTGNPFSTYVLGYYLKEKYGMAWVQDYRDPWMSNRYYLDHYYQGDKLTHNLQRQLEENLTQKADAILVVVKDFIKDYVEEYSIPEEKLFEITNGYDEADFKDIEEYGRNEKFTLCYSGTIYVDRNPVKLLEIINELLDENSIEPDEIQWIFNGTMEGSWEEILKEKDKYNIVINNGSLSHSASIKSAMNSDMLVLFGAVVGYTGKVFEYIRMKKPILSLSPEEGVLNGLLERTGTGKNFLYSDRENIKQYILECYNRWKNGNSVFVVNDTEIQKYSREYTTKVLTGIFDMVLEEKENGCNAYCGKPAAIH